MTQYISKSLDGRIIQNQNTVARYVTPHVPTSEDDLHTALLADLSKKGERVKQLGKKQPSLWDDITEQWRTPPDQFCQTYNRFWNGETEPHRVEHGMNKVPEAMLDKVIRQSIKVKDKNDPDELPEMLHSTKLGHDSRWAMPMDDVELLVKNKVMTDPIVQKAITDWLQSNETFVDENGKDKPVSLAVTFPLQDYKVGEGIKQMNDSNRYAWCETNCITLVFNKEQPTDKEPHPRSKDWGFRLSTMYPDVCGDQIFHSDHKNISQANPPSPHTKQVFAGGTPIVQETQPPIPFQEMLRKLETNPESTYGNIANISKKEPTSNQALTRMAIEYYAHPTLLREFDNTGFPAISVNYSTNPAYPNHLAVRFVTRDLDQTADAINQYEPDIGLPSASDAFKATYQRGGYKKLPYDTLYLFPPHTPAEEYTRSDNKTFQPIIPNDTGERCAVLVSGGDVHQTTQNYKGVTVPTTFNDRISELEKLTNNTPAGTLSKTLFNQLATDHQRENPGTTMPFIHKTIGGIDHFYTRQNTITLGQANRNETYDRHQSLNKLNSMAKHNKNKGKEIQKALNSSALIEVPKEQNAEYIIL